LTKLLVVGGARQGIGTAVAGLAVKNGLDVNVPDLYALDVTKQGTIDRYLKIHGPFDLVVYSVGMQKLQTINKIDMSTVHHIFDLNVNGYLRVITSLVKHQHGGRVCAVVSNASHTPMRGSIAYCTSKAALAMAVRCAARELAPHWVMTGVSPGVVDETPMTKSVDQQVMEVRRWDREQMMEYELSMVPMGRRVTKQEVAETVMFALTAPEMMTGTIIELTGGK